jgi:hypothetical protein
MAMAYAGITPLNIRGTTTIPPDAFHVHTPEELISAVYAITLQPPTLDRLKIDFYRPAIPCECPELTSPSPDPPIFAALSNDEEIDEIEAEEMAEAYRWANPPEPDAPQDGPGIPALVQCGATGKVYWKDGEPPKDTGTCHLPPGHYGSHAWERDTRDVHRPLPRRVQPFPLTDPALSVPATGDQAPPAADMDQGVPSNLGLGQP